MVATDTRAAAATSRIEMLGLLFGSKTEPPKIDLRVRMLGGSVYSATCNRLQLRQCNAMNPAASRRHCARQVPAGLLMGCGDRRLPDRRLAARRRSGPEHLAPLRPYP